VRTNRPNGPSPATSDEADTIRGLDELCRLAETLGTTLDIGSLLDQALDPLLKMTGARRAILMLSSTTEPALKTVACRGGDVRATIPLAQLAWLGDQARGFAEPEDMPEQLAGSLGLSRAPIAIAPLRVHSRLLGALVLERATDRFEVTTLKLLTTAGRQLALAVENSNLFEDLQRSYRQLMDAQEGLIRSGRMAALGQLSATLAHEIRNPLATIFSALSQIRKHANPDDVLTTLLDIAEEEAARLNNMVSGLLDFARPRRPVFEDSRPLQIARDVAQGLTESDSLPEGVELLIDPGSDDPRVRLDPDLLHKAISHLVANAIRAVADDGGRITIRVARPSGADQRALITIADDGPGIADDLLPKVFDPFFSTYPSGTGLGLPTVKRIAEDHGGALSLESKPGTGTQARLLIGEGGQDPSQEEPR
jgi:signal transduction histidine kinase